MDPFSLDKYRYDVPPDLVAQYPVEPRDHARLMVVNRSTGCIDEALVKDLPSFLLPSDALIFNNTKVLHASLQGQLEGGRAVDVLLTKKESVRLWWAMAKPAKKLQLNMLVMFAEGVNARVVEIREDGQRLLEFSTDLSEECLWAIGRVPLPPYIRRKPTLELDAKRYQTIYGVKTGSVAAPTAGLHFTPELFKNLSDKGVSQHFVTLHVGTGTFLPVRTEDVRQHKMHEELFTITPDVAHALNALPITARRIAVGTTSCRVLETVADDEGVIQARSDSTDIFIYPGYRFKYVNTLFTNFHTPESSLLLLVAAFMGYDLMREAYAKAVERRFRLFSYGDAMLIL
jgi:S-adenosylmethionine:tRNA ribosyltransferase-isomerase